MTTKKTAVNPAHVECAVCGFRGHILLKHIKEEHGMTAVEYSVNHPGEPVWSIAGGEIVKSILKGGDLLVTPDRDFETLEASDVFDGLEDVSLSVRKYIGEAPYVPPGSDENYIYAYEATVTLLLALHKDVRNSVWIAGYAGTGKTQLVLNVCRRLNREVVRINFDSAITRGDLIGDWTVVGGETKFKYGLLPQAMKRGAVLLLDEFDLANPYTVALFRPVLEECPRLAILENGGEVIDPHPDFRVVVTANTWGAGDESGLYGTTHSLSVADRQRFSLFIELEYLHEEAEKELLHRAVPDLDTESIAALVQVANAIRGRYKERSIEESLSPRQLVNWGEVYCDVGNALTAANMTFLRPLTQSTQVALTTLIQETGDLKK